MACISTPTSKKVSNMDKNTFKIEKNDVEWQSTLSSLEYRILRKKETEAPYTGKYEQFWDSGTYVCAGCNAELFTSETKFDAGCGWPSFYERINKMAVIELKDTSHGMIRTEVICASCGGHLGHVFTDGYGTPTGLRYCINSASLNFKKKE